MSLARANDDGLLSGLLRNLNALGLLRDPHALEHIRLLPWKYWMAEFQDGIRARI